MPFLTGTLLVSMLSFSVPAAVIPLVNHGDAWEYRPGTNAPQADWKAVSASLDATWLAGQGGFGYGTSAAETNNCRTLLTDMQNRHTTLYLRRTFTVTNAVDTDAHLYLRMDWDDGYIAWLDGAYLTNNASPNGTNEPPWDAVASNSGTGGHESSGGQNGNPAVVNDLGLVGSRLAVGDHVLTLMGLNVSSSSGDFIQVTDLYVDVPSAPLIITDDVTWDATNSPYTLTESATVGPSGTLTLEPGVTVRFRQGSGLTVQGRLLARGTAGEPITFTREPGDATWERIMFIEAGDSLLEHCVIEYANCVGDHKDYYDNDCNPATAPLPRRYHEAVVVLASHVDFDGCSFTNLPDASATAEGDALAIISDDVEHPGAASATVRNCNFVRIGQGVHTRSAYVLVENCLFKDKHGDNDDVDLVGESAPPSIIRNNLFLVPSYDDRIHPTRCSARIYGNTIYGSTDHGIVLRDVSRPIVFNNVLYNCSAGGISVQNGCDALLANNTLVNCNRAIKLFDHTDRHGPPYCLTPGSGRATVINCLIWNCNPAFDLADSVDGNSYVNVSHSDIQGGIGNATQGPNSTLIAGPGNIDSDPLFVSRANTNFHLLPGSLCIDAGTNLNALVTHDFDGTPRPLDGNGDRVAGFDLGAYEFLLPTADSNGDGVPDGWCQRYGFNPIDPSIASGNPDSDPFTNLQEYVADTDPTNALSAFRITAISNLPPVSVYFLSSSNRQYTLFYSTNLAGDAIGMAWTNVAGQGDVPGIGGTQALTDTNVGPARFYRVGAGISR